MCKQLPDAAQERPKLITGEASAAILAEAPANLVLASLPGTTKFIVIFRSVAKFDVHFFDPCVYLVFFGVTESRLREPCLTF